MFDVSFWELLVIGVIALIVVGPERLPGLMRTLGLWVGRARATFYSVRDEIEREANAQGLRDTQRALRDTERDLREGVQSTTDSVRSEAERARQGVEEAAGAAQAGNQTGTSTGDDDAAQHRGDQAER